MREQFRHYATQSWLWLVRKDEGGTEYTPRFVAYARAHGCTPDAMLARDRERYVGGPMAGFIVWLSERWEEWRHLNGVDPRAILSTKQHAAFDAWLQEQTRKDMTP